MGRLKLENTIQETLFEFSGGNPGALTFLMKLIKEREDDFVIDLMTIDDMGLYESKLYMLWNDSCNRDIHKVIKIFDLYRIGKITQNDIEERIKNVGYGKSFEDLLEDKTSKICSICGKKYEGYGNNAQPINDGRCCDYCNSTVVIPTRIQNFATKGKNNNGNKNI